MTQRHTTTNRKGVVHSANKDNSGEISDFHNIERNREQENIVLEQVQNTPFVPESDSIGDEDDDYYYDDNDSGDDRNSTCKCSNCISALYPNTTHVYINPSSDSGAGNGGDQNTTQRPKPHQLFNSGWRLLDEEQEYSDVYDDDGGDDQYDEEQKRKERDSVDGDNNDSITSIQQQRRHKQNQYRRVVVRQQKHFNNDGDNDGDIDDDDDDDDDDIDRNTSNHNRGYGSQLTATVAIPQSSKGKESRDRKLNQCQCPLRPCKPLPEDFIKQLCLAEMIVVTLDSKCDFSIILETLAAHDIVCVVFLVEYDRKQCRYVGKFVTDQTQLALKLLKSMIAQTKKPCVSCLSIVCVRDVVLLKYNEKSYRANYLALLFERLECQGIKIRTLQPTAIASNQILLDTYDREGLLKSLLDCDRVELEDCFPTESGAHSGIQSKRGINNSGGKDSRVGAGGDGVVTHSKGKKSAAPVSKSIKRSVRAKGGKVSLSRKLRQ
jgi:hypothetical protein